MNWLTTTLTPIIAGIEVMSSCIALIACWKKPVSHTLCITINMDAKNRRVCQSTFLMSKRRFLLPMSTGRQANAAIRVSDIPAPVPKNASRIFRIISAISTSSDAFDSLVRL